ncbi:family A G protein-coupled receptor-like protein [Tothia fuscella]|uniref:Family A G protein-coupled receptor-like protein n=1 Tax=Tothia fuscella TaxID=1048955 RepID=A0A9P4NZZ0_9PEZI|nr:family A G protein-coupled receptor-like protein [Tothia fuscella]
MEFQKRANDALNVNGNTVNGRTSDINITTHGSDWYWAVCALMIVATMVFIGLGFRKPRTHRIFHYITASITMVAAIAYFSMASNLGFTPIQVQYRRSDPKVSGVFREIFYVRYIDWVITTPLLLLDLLLTAGMPWPSILFVILVDEVMIVTGLAGALVVSSYKWGYFAFGCAALAYIVYQLGWESRKHANHLGTDIGRVFLMCGSLTTFLWILYPIAWGICEGGNLIAPDSEAAFYGVLDVLAKPVFGALLLFGHRNIDPSRLGLRIRDYDEDPAVTGGSKGHEKGHTGNGVDGAHNGHSNGHNAATNDVPATTV